MTEPTYVRQYHAIPKVLNKYLEGNEQREEHCASGVDCVTTPTSS